MSVRLYVDAALRRDAEIDLPEAAARHVQVRRLQPGDALRLFDGRGGEWAATVQQMGRQRVAVRVGAHHAIERELRVAVTLALGMPANERMDWLVEKATELGAQAIVPLHTERSVLRLDAERGERKRAHWQGIAAAAAGQCGRNRLPQIAPVQPLQALLAQPAAAARRLLLTPDAAAPPLARAAAGAEALLCLSGPEGGLTPDEEAAARAAGFQPVQLGPRVLRAETAPLAVLAWIGLNG